MWIWLLIRVILGTVWAGGILYWSLGLWGNVLALTLQAGDWGLPTSAVASALRTAAVAGISAAQFIFMVLVADVLCPGADRTFVGFLKAFTGILAVLASVWVAWGVGGLQFFP